MESPKTDDQMEKNPPSGAAKSRKILHLRNEVALVGVALSLSGGLVVVPRPTYPQALPLPEVDSRQIRTRENEELRRALSVVDGSLDKEARAIGEQIRRIGYTLSVSRSVDPETLRRLRVDVQKLQGREKTADLPEGIEALLALRALQGQLFLDAIKNWLRDGKPSRDLHELGGPFLSLAREAWLRDDHLVLNDDELRLLFRVHFGKVTGLSETKAFAPSLEELKRYYLTHLEHPPGPRSDVRSQTAAQLRFVRALMKIDSNYPGLLAEGILELRLGRPAQAAASLRAHLTRHPDGAFAHLARNHLLLAKREAAKLSQVGY